MRKDKGLGRPPLPLGTFGKIGFVDQPNGQVQARAKFRDYDGRVRLVSKSGRSRAAAERALKAELSDRQTPGGSGAITAVMSVDALADIWLEAAHGWSTGTERTYRSVIKTQVKPALGQLRIREVSPGAVSRALTAMASRSGPSAAKSARACLSSMFGLAIEDGAIMINPVRDSTARISVGKKSPRALTRRRSCATGCARTTTRTSSTSPTWSTGCWRLAVASARFSPSGTEPTETGSR